jgi:hypothetical protein
LRVFAVVRARATLFIANLLNFFFPSAKEHRTMSIMRQLEQVISQSTVLISQARASLERDKKLIEKSIDLMSRSFILLKQMSASMELNEWLEAQLAGMESTPKKTISG